MGYFRAQWTLSDRAVVTGRQTGLGSPRNRLSQILILDGRGDPRALCAIGLADLRHGPFRSFYRFRPGFRNRPRSEPQRGRRGLSEALPQPLQDRGCELRELEGPRARARGNVEASVPREASRPRARGDPRSHALGPRGDGARGARGRTEAGELAAHLVLDRSERAESH